MEEPFDAPGSSALEALLARPGAPIVSGAQDEIGGGWDWNDALDDSDAAPTPSSDALAAFVDLTRPPDPSGPNRALPVLPGLLVPRGARVHDLFDEEALARRTADPGRPRYLTAEHLLDPGEPLVKDADDITRPLAVVAEVVLIDGAARARLDATASELTGRSGLDATGDGAGSHVLRHPRFSPPQLRFAAAIAAAAVFAGALYIALQRPTHGDVEVGAVQTPAIESTDAGRGTEPTLTTEPPVSATETSEVESSAPTSTPGTPTPTIVATPVSSPTTTSRPSSTSSPRTTSAPTTTFSSTSPPTTTPSSPPPNTTTTVPNTTTTLPGTTTTLPTTTTTVPNTTTTVPNTTTTPPPPPTTTTSTTTTTTTTTTTLPTP